MGWGSLQFAPVFENLQLTTKKTKEVSLHAANNSRNRDKEKEGKKLRWDLQCNCNRLLSKPDLLIFFKCTASKSFHWTYHGCKRHFQYLFCGLDHIVPYPIGQPTGWMGS